MKTYFVIGVFLFLTDCAFGMAINFLIPLRAWYAYILAGIAFLSGIFLGLAIKKAEEKMWKRTFSGLFKTTKEL